MKPLLRSLLTALCLMSASAAPHPSIPAADTLDGLGVNIHFTDARPGELAMMAAAGFKWVRMDLGWEATEKTRGVYDFSAYDRLLAALETNKMRAVLILDYSHRFYEQDRSVASAEGRAAYAKWAAATVLHFAGRGVLWELWNEPNIEGFWKPQPNAADYAAMAVAAAKAIRAAAPGEPIVGPGSSGIDLKFIETCGQAGLLDYWDAVSVHPYRQEGPETVVGEYARLRALIRHHAPPGRTLPILSSEWGYSAAWQHFDAAKQGRMLAREWLLNLSQGIPVSIWYDWHDDGTDAKEPEHHFGTVEHEFHANAAPIYTPKPAYFAARTLTTTLAGSHFVKRVALGNPENYALLFAKGEAWMLALWTTTATPCMADIPSSPGTWNRTSHTGGTIVPPLVAAAGVVTVMLRDEPVYLTGNVANARLLQAPAEPPLTLSVRPALGGVMEVAVGNLGCGEFAGTATLTDIMGLEPTLTRLPFTLKDDGVASILRFPLAKVPAGEYQAGVKIEVGGQVLLEQPARRFTSIPADPFLASRVLPDGDAKVRSRQTIEVASVPFDPPGTGQAAMVRISYQMEAGWKFIQAAPPANTAVAIPGQPTAFGCWIHSPAPSGLSPRMRVKDATGQVWQPTGEPLNATGWQYVEFPLDAARCGHWGGRNDGVIHYPLSWEAFILLDNVARTPTAGSVTLTVPLVVY